MNDRQRLEAIVAVVCKYLPPDGISRQDAMNEIIGLVDPLPKQSAQNPYCWVQAKLNQGLFYKEKPRRIHTIPLYTAPLKREWVGLTDSDIALVSINSGSTTENFVNGIESKLKELNT